MSVRRVLLGGSAAALLLAASFGCGNGLPDKMKYAAPPTALLQGGVSVTFQLAHADEDEMKVRFYVTNISNQIMTVNRDGFALRLPDGRILPRAGSSHDLYHLGPGQGHNVWVAFKQSGLDLRTVQTASVIIGGITYQSDPMPRVVGEIPLTLAGSADD
jgi:hypothetical protein